MASPALLAFAALPAASRGCGLDLLIEERSAPSCPGASSRRWRTTKQGKDLARQSPLAPPRPAALKINISSTALHILLGELRMYAEAVLDARSP